jgi:hypothetical protein
MHLTPTIDRLGWHHRLMAFSRNPCSVTIFRPVSWLNRSWTRGITDRDHLAGSDLLINPNPTFEWLRLARRIPVRIHIDDVPKGVLVSSGMTAAAVMEAPRRQWATVAALRGWQAAAR